MKGAIIRPAILLLVVCASLQFSRAAHAADSFGRLFTSPPERANLDRLRQTAKAATLNQPLETSTDAAPAAAPATPQPITMQGYVKRSDGKKGTVWVNNKPLQEGAASDAIEVGRLARNGNQVELTMPTTGKRIKLKAGQVYLLDSGKIKEEGAYARESGEESVDRGSIGGNESLQDESPRP